MLPRENPEYLTAKDARKNLGVSKVKMANLIKKGVIHTHPDPLDSRVKLIKKDDLAALKVNRTSPHERSGR